MPLIADNKTLWGFGDSFTPAHKNVGTLINFTAENMLKSIDPTKNVLIKLIPVKNTALNNVVEAGHVQWATLNTVYTNKEIHIIKEPLTAKIMATGASGDNLKYTFFLYSGVQTDLIVEIYNVGDIAPRYRQIFDYSGQLFGAASHFVFANYTTNQLTFEGSITAKNYSTSPIAYVTPLNSLTKIVGYKCDLNNTNTPAPVSQSLELVMPHPNGGEFQVAAPGVSETIPFKLTLTILPGSPAFNAVKNPFSSCYISSQVQRVIACSEKLASNDCKAKYIDYAASNTNPDTDNNGTPHNDSYTQRFNF